MRSQLFNPRLQVGPLELLLEAQNHFVAIFTTNTDVNLGENVLAFFNKLARCGDQAVGAYPTFRSCRHILLHPITQLLQYRPSGADVLRNELDRLPGSVDFLREGVQVVGGFQP